MNKKQIKEKINLEFQNETPNVKESILKKIEGESQLPPTDEIALSKTNIWKVFACIFLSLALFVVGVVAGKLVNFGGKPSLETSLYIDVNPSIEIQLDKDNIVLKVNANNTDAEKVLSGMNLEGVEMDTAINAIVGSLYINGYLTTESNSMLISIDTKDENNSMALIQGISQKANGVLQGAGIELAIITQSVSNTEELQNRAKEQGISIGKMHLIEKMLDNDEVSYQGSALTEQDIPILAKMPIKDLNLMYSNTPVGLPAGKPAPEEIISGNVGGYIEKEEAYNAVLTTLGLEESQIEWHEVRVRPNQEKNGVIYMVTIKKIGENKVFSYDVHPENGNVIASRTEGEFPPPPMDNEHDD